MSAAQNSGKILNQFPIEFDPEIFNSTEPIEIFNQIVDKVYESLEYDEIKDIPDPSIRILCYIFGMHYQIENGGVMQFLDNGSGNNFEETLSSLEEINASAQMNVLLNVKTAFPNKIVAKDWEERRCQIDQINENDVSRVSNFDSEEFWESLDKMYYRSYDSLYIAVNSFVRNYINK